MRHLHHEQRKVLIRRGWGSLQSREELHDRFIARGFRRVCGPADAGLVDGQLEALPALEAGIDKPSVPARAQVDDGAVDGVLIPISGAEGFPDTSSTSRSPAMNCSTLIADRASVSIP